MRRPMEYRGLAGHQPYRRPPPRSPVLKRQRTWALSDRERQIADLIVEGLTHKEIAKRLQLATGTIKIYTARMYQKMDLPPGVNGRMALLLRAQRERPDLKLHTLADCQRCMFRGFAEWARTCAGQLLLPE